MSETVRNVFAPVPKAWPFEEAVKVASRLTASGKPEALFETGYGPSGLPHIGTFGEVARTSWVRHAFGELTGLPSRLLAFSDDMDGLRKVPDNVPNRDMLAQHLGKPLTRIPDPFGTHDSFGAHNNARLRAFLDGFGFEYEFASSTEYYAAGRFDDALVRVLACFDEVMAVILPTLGPDRRATYSPILPIHPHTGIVMQVPMEGRDPVAGTVVWRDPETGERFETTVKGGACKLQWKADWAMRWYALGVDYEMSGKDLIDSVRLSSRICRVLGAPPPETFTYELFLDEHAQKISKSKGNGLSVDDWLRYAPPESLAQFMYNQPQRAKRLYFDAIPRAVDEYIANVEKARSQGAAASSPGSTDRPVRTDPMQTDPALASPALGSPAQGSPAQGSPAQTSPGQANPAQANSSSSPVQTNPVQANPAWHVHAGRLPNHAGSPLSFTMLLNLASVVNADTPDILWGFIRRYIPGANADTEPLLARLVDHAIAYYQDFVRPAKRFRDASATERAALEDLARSLGDLPADSNAEAIQNVVYETGKRHPFAELKAWFSCLYQVLLGQQEGPRFGGFVALYGIPETIALINSSLTRQANAA